MLYIDGNISELKNGLGNTRKDLLEIKINLGINDKGNPTKLGNLDKQIDKVGVEVKTYLQQIKNSLGINGRGSSAKLDILSNQINTVREDINQVQDSIIIEK
jgi:hypothetical protein